MLAVDLDATVVARLACCTHCQAAQREGDQTLSPRYHEIELPPVQPLVTRVKRFAGHCPSYCGITLASIPAACGQQLQRAQTTAHRHIPRRKRRFPLPWRVDLFTFFRFVIGTVSRNGIGLYQASSSLPWFKLLSETDTVTAPSPSACDQCPSEDSSIAWPASGSPAGGIVKCWVPLPKKTAVDGRDTIPS